MIPNMLGNSVLKIVLDPFAWVFAWKLAVVGNLRRLERQKKTELSLFMRKKQLSKF